MRCGPARCATARRKTWPPPVPAPTARLALGLPGGGAAQPRGIPVVIPAAIPRPSPLAWPCPGCALRPATRSPGACRGDGQKRASSHIPVQSALLNLQFPPLRATRLPRQGAAPVTGQPRPKPLNGPRGPPAPPPCHAGPRLAPHGRADSRMAPHGRMAGWVGDGRVGGCAAHESRPFHPPASPARAPAGKAAAGRRRAGRLRPWLGCAGPVMSWPVMPGPGPCRCHTGPSPPAGPRLRPPCAGALGGWAKKGVFAHPYSKIAIKIAFITFAVLPAR